MLSFIYCGKVHDLKEDTETMELLKVADQYQLDGLKGSKVLNCFRVEYKFVSFSTKHLG